jgi:hypothetical protein
MARRRGAPARLLERERSRRWWRRGAPARVRYSWAAWAPPCASVTTRTTHAPAPCPEIPAEAGARLTLGHAPRAVRVLGEPEHGLRVAAGVEGRRYLELAGAADGRGYLRATGARAALPPPQPRRLLAPRARRAVAGRDRPRRRAPRLLARRDRGRRGLARPLSTSLSSGAGWTPGARLPGRRAVRRPRRGGVRWSTASPIALVERGWRLAPDLLDRLWGTAFLDAGRAECSAECLRAPHLRAHHARLGARSSARTSAFVRAPRPLPLRRRHPLTSLD